MPRFSIIVTHFQPSIPHEIFMRGIQCLKAQTSGDFEILCYHDGPLTMPAPGSPVEIRCSVSRFNDWGHSLRDWGMREAAGDYIVHFNADNILYPHALEHISREIDRKPRLFNGVTPLDLDNIIIFPIKMYGMMRFHNHAIRFKGADFFSIYTGDPPVYLNIDCMQLVMKRSLWLAEGGWSDKTETSDGKMYQRFAQKYGYRAVGEVLGEHH